jgi:hypothetical protein
MTKVSQRLDSIVKSELSKNIIPVKTAEGILVGNVLIVNDKNIKHLRIDDVFVYTNISLNATAILLANLLARNIRTVRMDEIWRADQEYGKWFVDSQMLRSQYQRSLNNQDFDRADMQWARYCESRDRAVKAKNYVETLISI